MSAGLAYAERSARDAQAVATRGSRGTARWYLASVSEGSERSTCARVRAILPTDLLADAFVPRKERWFKHGPVWELQQVPLFKGYFVVVTANARALSAALERLSFPVRLSGAMGRGFTPVSAGVREFLSSNMDANHVIRNSTGELVSSRVHVLCGPLVGQEDRITSVNRHMRRAAVRVRDGQREYLEILAMDIPVRREAMDG